MCVDAAKKADNTVLACLPSAYTAMVLYVIDSPLYGGQTGILGVVKATYCVILYGDGD